jgi:hypothetical protein
MSLPSTDRAAQLSESPADSLDLDLVEYVLLSAATMQALTPAASATLALARAGSIQLVDVVLLTRPGDDTMVRTVSPSEDPTLAALARAVCGGLELSPHDVELVALTLAPSESALLMLVVDRWAGALSEALRKGGARVAGGERIPRDRLTAWLDALASTARRDRVDLLVRGPGTTPAVDHVAQVRELSRLVRLGILPLERYEIQRRRVLHG